MSYSNSNLTAEEIEVVTQVLKLHLLFNGSYVFFIVPYWILICRRGIHLNLKILLMHLPLVYWISSLGQSYHCVLFFYDAPLVSHTHVSVWISDSGAFANIYNMNVLVLERCVATIRVAEYEKIDSKIPKTGIFLVITQWSVGVLTFYLVHVPELYHFTGCVIGVVNTILVVTALIMLPRVTKEIHDNLKPTYNNNNTSSEIWDVTLSERYQSSENLKMTTVVNIILLVELIFTLFEMACHYLVRCQTFLSVSWVIYLHILYSSIGIESITLMAIILFGTATQRGRRSRKVVISCYSPEAVNQIYFRTYERAWGKQPSKAF
ncbi:hypothetical protein M3Y95_00622900 [Aphelenchoides besseyi]|nr:hypothetical protein M3Y95_00622900 [Aphelenchoides besseyi]